MSQSISPRPSRRLLGGPTRFHRVGDPIELAARLLCALAVLLAVPVALTVGAVAGADARQRADSEAATLVQVPAVLVADAVGPTGQSWTSSVPTPATWRAPDGSSREGPVPAAAGAAAGQTVTIWVDGEGHRTRPPLDAAAVATSAVSTGLMTFLVLAALALSGHHLVRGLLERQRSRRWAEDWAAVEPEWSGRC